MFKRLLAAAALFATIVTAAQASDADFRLYNKTGYQIDNVWVGPHSSRSWGHDILGRDTLDDGENVKITFPHNSSACMFDIKVKYHDDDEAEWGNIDLCKYEKISLYWTGKQTRAVME